MRRQPKGLRFGNPFGGVMGGIPNNSKKCRNHGFCRPPKNLGDARGLSTAAWRFETEKTSRTVKVEVPSHVSETLTVKPKPVFRSTPKSCDHTTTRNRYRRSTKALRYLQSASGDPKKSKPVHPELFALESLQSDANLKPQFNKPRNKVQIKRKFDCFEGTVMEELRTGCQYLAESRSLRCASHTLMCQAFSFALIH
jgi:hypothetical protein